MTSHFWMRKQELCGSTRKPFRNSKAVQEAYQAKVAQEKREEAARAAANRLDRALRAIIPRPGEDWMSLKARILAKVAA
jgi:hypothetical protein